MLGVGALLIAGMLDLVDEIKKKNDLARDRN